MTSPPADAPLQPGDIVGGRYRVIQSAGEGPLDRLYEAQDVHQHERVIVRVMRQATPGDEGRRRMFEEQARTLGVPEDDRSIRLLELSRDEELGNFAAISNRDNRPLSEVLAQMTGVDGVEPEPAPPPTPMGGYRFPSSQSQVELESVTPSTAPPAQERDEPRFAQPRRPKRLDTLELDTPHVSRSTGPRPALSVKPRTWVQPLKRAGLVLLAMAVLGGGVLFYFNRLNRQGRGGAAEAEPGENNATVMAPHREVQIIFRVEPARARLRIDGKLAPGHSILVPESDESLQVRFEAAGYLPRSINVVPDQNRTVHVVLIRKPKR